jgi:hypothetical protein
VGGWAIGFGSQPHDRGAGERPAPERLMRRLTVDHVRERVEAAGYTLLSEYRTAREKVIVRCTIPEFRIYIEALFEPGMTWANWGRGPGTWQIDHRRPLASFDLTKREDVLVACHFLNLQPLWSEENMRKGARE